MKSALIRGFYGKETACANCANYHGVRFEIDALPYCAVCAVTLFSRKADAEHARLELVNIRASIGNLFRYAEERATSPVDGGKFGPSPFREGMAAAYGDIARKLIVVEAGVFEYEVAAEKGAMRTS